jgi:hypothetical protein
MRRYIISCELYRAKRAGPVADCIRRFASEWQHPLNNVWIVKTPLSASDIRSALLPHLDFQDRLYVCEAVGEASEFNALAASGGKVTQIGEARVKNRMLASIFNRDGNSSRLLKAAAPQDLKAATAKSWRSA